MSWSEQRDAFEAWADDVKHRPTAPDQALIRATNEQTRAIYALVALVEGVSSSLADMIDREETRDQRNRESIKNIYQTITGQPHE